jgi:phosphate transport system permease protein
MEEESHRMVSETLGKKQVVLPTTDDDVARSLAKRPRIGETIIEAGLFLAGAVSILTTLGIVYILVRDALDFFLLPEVTLIEFLTGTTWLPQIGNFGVWPLLLSTLIISFIAMLVGVPLGFFTAIYLSEYASARFRAFLKPVLEILAGIPTVVLGYFALTFVTPLLRGVLGDDVVKIYNMASAGIVVGILTIPLIASLSEDALHAVPDSLRQAAYGLGATRMETSLRVVSPAALSGISAAVVVAASRAMGETMIVALAAGAGPNFTFNPFESAETMTGYMVRISGGDLSYGSIDYQSIFAVGLVVFTLTLLLNIVSQRIVRRFREVYE